MRKQNIRNRNDRIMNIKIIVAAHKKYQMPNDTMYLPLHVGKAGKEGIGFQGDDTGDNISETNARLCELTGIYWAWKNLDADYVGLVHYRRHFTKLSRLQRIGKDKFNCIIEQVELEELLKKYDVVLPAKRKYYIETLLSHYNHLPYTFEADTEKMRQVLAEVQPEYLEAYDRVMNRTSAHMFNMFVMKREIYDKYCEWLFSIILEADKRVDVAGYTPMEARAVAYFAEFMFDVWNEKNNANYCELPVMFMEKQNWFVKGGNFIKRKFIKK